ncbi:MAG: DHH family phosphoesterase [Christensenellaceae bacterium]|jgi:phosphoesterase RecJ-like protein|nr:DHH family phosphoesterase [Christensenellaceae bacterium]
MEKNTYDELIAGIKGAKTFALITHKFPDADAFCSKKAFARLIRNVNPEATVHKFVEYNDKENLGRYEHLFHNRLDELNPEEPLQQYDMVVALDCAEPHRMGKYLPIFENGKTTVNIDHHENPKYADKNYVDDKASSTCEILYEIFKEQDIHVSDSTASVLYGGMMTDTGHFKNNATARTFRIVSEIFDIASPERVNELLSDKTVEGTKIFRNCKQNFLYDGRFAVANITQKDIEDANATYRDVLGMSDELLSHRGVYIAIVFAHEKDGLIRASCRADKGHSIVDIVKSQGGGYSSEQVGAFSSKKHVDEVYTELMPFIEKQINQNVVEHNPFLDATSYARFAHPKKQSLKHLLQSAIMLHPVIKQ